MRSHWKTRMLRRVSFGVHPPLPPKVLLYVAVILSAAAVVLSAGIVATGPPGEHG